MTLSPTVTDVIAELSGIEPGSALAELRAQRPEAMTHAQGSYAALFDPASVRGLSPTERLAVAERVASRHASTAAATHYGVSHTETPRLQAMLRHADLLSNRPRQAGHDDLQALADAGLSTQAIVTLSQTIGFVSFQVRVIAMLRLLGGGDP